VVWLWRGLKRRLPTWRRFFYWRLAKRIPEGARRKHTYIFGSSGSGKTEPLKILVYGLIRKPRFCTTIVLDPNSDMASQVARWNENSSGDRCVVIDLGLHAGFSPVINPLQSNTS
jgi:type IV secretory pathway TraG/TraD family ATPase VirD4